MANTLANLRMDQIKLNPLNLDRSMNQAEILNLKSSISEVGLLHPLTVYQENANEYVLISGHKRYKALEALGKSGSSEVTCTVVPKPIDTTREIEIMARANVHRSKPEDIQKEVEICNNVWNTMSKEKRENWIRKFEEKFEQTYSEDPRFREDPVKFKSNRFRPRLMYINHISGLNASNRTLTTYLSNTLKSEGEEEVTEKKVKRVRKIGKKDILRSMDSLIGIIDIAEYSGAIPSELMEIKDKLIDTKDWLEKVERL